MKAAPCRRRSFHGGPLRGPQVPDSRWNWPSGLGIELNRYNFVKTDPFTPVETSRPGVYTCGVFQGPKDIPGSVTEASAAACGRRRCGEARGPDIEKITVPEEIDVVGQEPRVGVFVCNCGINIGGIVDVPAVQDYAATLPDVVFTDNNLFTCSQDTQEKIKEMITSTI
jgi:heterodisulfide reductase subunit A-like polyferredoxin